MCLCICDCVSIVYYIFIFFLEFLMGFYIINCIYLKYFYLYKLVCFVCEYYGYFGFVYMSLCFDNDLKFWDIMEVNINILFFV